MQESSLICRDFVMPQFDPELIQIMRDALDDAMTRVPLEHSTVEVKARLGRRLKVRRAMMHWSPPLPIRSM